ncbi:MAG: hypothetical protein LBO00_10125 [Zoogloeaceae bacterium]|nr:hypothetical protein [Zoogloeaceae bacterium]
MNTSRTGQAQAGRAQISQTACHSPPKSAFGIRPGITPALGAVLTAFLLFQATEAAAASIEKIEASRQPLIVGGAQAPNIFFLFDNSFLMQSSQLPINVPEFGMRTTGDYARPHYQNLAARSYYLNKLAYNPEKKYTPPRKADDCSSGTCVKQYYPDSSFTAAWRDGYGAGAPNPLVPVDLSKWYRDRTFGGLTVYSRSQPDNNSNCTYTGTTYDPSDCSHTYADEAPRSAYYTYFNPANPKSQARIGPKVGYTGGCVYQVRKGSLTGPLYNIIDLDPTDTEVDYYPAWCSSTSGNECKKWSIADLTGSGTSDANLATGHSAMSGWRDAPGGLTFADPFQVCFEIVEVGSPRDLELTGMSEDEAKTNFANWYSYYGTRVNLMKSAVSEVLNDLDSDLRIGFGVTAAGGGKVQHADCDASWAAGDLHHCENGRAFKSQNPAAWGGTRADFRAGLHAQLVDGMASAVNGGGFYGLERGVRPFRNFDDDDESVPDAYQGQKFKDQVFDYLFSLGTATLSDQKLEQEHNADLSDNDTGGKTARSGEARDTAFAGLRRAVGEVGEYYRLKDVRGPWSRYPGLTKEQAPEGKTYKPQAIQACRKSFLVLVTAGIYYVHNDNRPVNECARGDQDGISGQSFIIPDGGTDCMGKAAEANASTYNDNRYMPGSSNTFGDWRLSEAPRGARGEQYPYFPQLPFADRINVPLTGSGVRPGETNYAGYPNTLADVAMAYWKSDLLIGDTANTDEFRNNVPYSGEDQAYWQHMNTVVLQLGDRASIDPTAALVGKPGWGYNAQIITPPECAVPHPRGDGTGGQEWCDPTTDIGLHAPRRYKFGNDLLHASINGHGGYYSVESPEEFTAALKKGMEALREGGLSFTRVESNGGSPNTPLLYFASFSSNNWFGDLDAHRICSGKDVSRDLNTTVSPPTWKTGYNERAKCVREGDPWAMPDWRVSSKDESGQAGILNTQGKTSRYIYVSKGWGDGATGPMVSLIALTDADLDPGAPAGEKTLIDYLYGDAANEKKDDGTGKYRSRDTSDLDIICGTDAAPEPCKDDGSNKSTAHQVPPERHVLGDIVNSSPLFVGNDDFGWSTAGALTSAQRTAYTTRKVSLSGVAGNKDRKELIWVGANDGMLHAFDASPNPTADGSRGAGTGGREVFAFIPYHARGKLASLADPNYSHEFYVDGEISVGDAFIPGPGENDVQGWHTVLVGAAGYGGGAYYALDIERQPDNIQKLWEISSEITTEPRYGKIGALTVGKASVALLSNSASGTTTTQWTAIFGNGYNSTGNRAALYVVNLKDGSPVAVLDVYRNADQALTTANGLSAPIVADFDQDGDADVAYAGDLRGNLWRFPLNNLTGDVNTNAGVLLFEAGKDQPITGQPEVARINGNVMVYFGTGKYLEIKDGNSNAVQSIYGVRDPCGMATACDSTAAGLPLKPADLVAQTIANEVKKSVCSTNVTNCSDPTVSDVRVVSANQLDTSGNLKSGLTRNGFRLDLVYNSKKEGERVIAKPLVWDDRVIFTSIIPTGEDCAVDGADGWLYELDPQWGSRLKFSAFDLDGDGQFGDANDLVGGEVASGKRVGMTGGGATSRGDTKYVGGRGGITAVANNPEHGVQGRRYLLRIR